MLPKWARAILSTLSAIATLWSLGHIVLIVATRRDSVTEFLGLSWSFNASGYALLAMVGLGGLALTNLAWLWQVFRPKSHKFAELQSEMVRTASALASNTAEVVLRDRFGDGDPIGVANAQRIAIMRRKLEEMGINCPNESTEPTWHVYLSGLVVLAEDRDYRGARNFYRGE